MDDFDTATYSIESEPDRKQISLDDVILPTVRRSAIQIVSLSPRRQAKRTGPLTTAGADNSTMQVTKLVLKTPPGSPKRQPKPPGVIIKSIQTLAGPGLTGSSSVLTEKRNLPATAASDETVASYRITPILSPQNKDTRKEFEVRRTERERATNDFQDFLRESFKENKTPPSTPPPPPSSAIEVTRIVEKGSSEADSTSASLIPHKSAGRSGSQRVERLHPAREEQKADGETQCAAQAAQFVPATQQPVAARRSLLMETPKQADIVQPAIELITAESINQPPGELSVTSIKMPPPPQIANQESHVTVETAKSAQPAAQVRPKPPSKPTSSTITKSAAVVEDAKKKEKSYDPAKAREFMREQQAKRRMEKKENPVGVSGSSKGGTAEKDLIKQRLETLRQSSQKLVSKNLQKARKRSVSCAPKEVANLNKRPPTGKDKDPASVPCNDRRSSIRPTMGLRKFASTPSLRLIKKDKDPQDFKPAVVLKPKDPSPNIPPKPLSAGSRGSDLRLGKESSSGRSTNPSTASTISKSSIKIGILRKPDHLTLEDIVPQSPLKVSQAISLPTKPKVNAQLIEINAEDDSSEPKTAAEKELKLQVPAVMLVPTNACALPVKQLKQPEGSVTSSKVEEIPAQEVPQSQPVKSIPSWLKQSLRQPDPYPFILAVRKKLEAVQSVRDERDKPTACKELEQKQVEQKMPSTRYSSYMNEIESVPFIRKGFATAGQRTEESALNKRPFGNVQEEASSIVTKISPCSSPNTTSDISSIKSDLALPLPPLLSSTKIEIPAGPHDSAATSGPISPLSVERISQMKIATPGNTTARSPHHDRKVLEKTRASSPSRPHAAVHNTSNISHLDRSQKELEYQRLLESFNRSLTHVIEVNQQLYSALKNVPTTAAMPLFPQDVLRLRDEMTQTSLAMPRASTATGSETVDSDQQGGKASDAITTTASNYSDDFEHQSQTEAPPPPTTPHETVASPSSTASSSATSSSSSSANSSARSDTGESTTKSSSQSSSTSSSFDRNEPVVASPREHVPSRPETNATDDERKATSNTTTAHSSDFDSRSFSLSDSHNNTTNNHPPMPEEYLPSFEESLRRKRYSSDREQRTEMEENHEEQKRANKQISRESSIDEEIQPSQDEERSYSFKHSENANDSKVNSFLPLVASSSEDSVTKGNQRTQQPNKDSLLYVENPDATINSELLTAMFNRTDLEVSILSTTVSETNLSYSSIGMYDQLIHTERSKEEHLVSRVQSKQKALLNRAKGQLAWLELQKQRYREKGLTDQVTAVKKKQRAILLRLQKDRAELNRALKSSTESSRTMTANDPVLTSRMVDSKLNSYCSSPVANNSGSLTLRKSSSSLRIARHQHSRTPEGAERGVSGTTTTTTTTSNSIQIAIRGRELEPNDRLEDILTRREEELRKRKEHVQHLLEWHRKLEREEEELMAVEDRLLAYNSRKLETANAPRRHAITIEQRVQRIEKSLKTLQSIPSTVARRDQEQAQGRDSDTGDKEPPESAEEIVLTGGSKLNKFWYRLTGIEEQRYEPGRNYPITRHHMEALFEDAKRCVLERFQRNEGQLKEALLDQSIKIVRRKGASDTDANTTGSVEDQEKSLQSTAAGEETVRTVEERKESQHDDATVAGNETTYTERTGDDLVVVVSQEEPDAMDGGELPPMVEDAKCLLSSTVNGWSPGSRRSIESVEFHTLEETSTPYQSALRNDEQEVTVEEEPAKSDSYSTTFEQQSVGGVEAGDESQLLIEDMSLPPMLLNNTSLKIESDEDSASSSSCESSATVELSVPLATAEEKVQEELPNGEGDDLGTISSDTSISIAQSLEEASEGSSHGSTPTTVTPTIVAESIESKEQHPPADEGEDGGVESVSPKQNSSNVPSEVASDNSYEEDIFHTKSSSVSGSAQATTSELAKRLATLHDELEELSETFERTPLMKSPVTAAASLASKSDQCEDQNSSEETITFDYEDDRAESPSPSDGPSKDDDDKASIDATVSQNAAKIEVKLRSKVLSSSGDTVAIVAGSGSVYGRDYPAPLQQLYHHHQTEPPVSSSSSPNIGVRMPDIINEAEVLRRQQLQIEQEIKELEQQVGFFREIPNKPPPPYIPPANGSPLALLFPSEPRIDELIDGRVEELHRDRIAPENLRSDHVTNVYEKLILDMCKELYRDLRPAEPTVSFRTIPHDKRPLVFHNPPDALRCMKDYLRGKIRRVLNDAQLALQQQQHQHQQHQLLLHHQLQQQQQQQTHPSHPQLHHHHLLHHGHCTATMPFLYGNGCASKRKPDQVDEILKQETHDDDARWTNFDREEIEVKDRITDELLKSLLAEALQDMVEACERKEGKEASLVQRQESAM